MAQVNKHTYLPMLVTMWFAIFAIVHLAVVKPRAKARRLKR